MFATAEARLTHFCGSNEHSMQADSIKKNMATLNEEILDCPNCDNVGCIANQIGDNDWEQIQCQWCYETPNSRFNYERRLTAEENAI